MGTGLAAMAWITALSLVLHSLSYLQAQDICCKTKIVSGTLAEDQGLAGTYTLLRDAGTAPDAACANGCVYSRDGMEGDEYCFQAVAAGADIEDQECGADTGATEGTLPSEGETPEGTPPVEGETEEGTAPVEGETPEGTPPVEGETPEGTPPVEGETTDGTPSMQISTAKPARMLFERKRRSRGSML